jgi:hypothetical protein
MMLSEKAKGKQKALDIPLSEPSGSSAPNSRNLTIRFTEDIQDLDVIVKEKDTVRDVKKAVRPEVVSQVPSSYSRKQIRLERPELKDRRLRLIHSGKLLTDGILVFPWLNSLDERQKRAVAESNTGDLSIPSVAAWLHCSVGGKLEETEEGVEEEGSQVG